MKVKKKLRPLGQITLDMEPLLEEMVHEHELQHQEVLYIILSWLETHAPEAKPRYEDGNVPMLVYGHPDTFKDGN
jgi:hypothetical protein